MFRWTHSIAVAGLSCLIGVSGCSAWPALVPLARQKDQTTVLPTESGAQYVNVSTGRSSSAALVRRKWKVAARSTCDGDYVVLSEDASERRTAGVVSGRSHEGYVRCVLPDPTRSDSRTATATAPE